MQPLTATRAFESKVFGPDAATSILLSLCEASTACLTMASMSGRPSSTASPNMAGFDERVNVWPKSALSCSSSGDGVRNGHEISSLEILCAVTWSLRLTFGELWSSDSSCSNQVR